MRIFVNLDLNDSTVQIIPFLCNSTNEVEDVYVANVITYDKLVAFVAAHILGGRLFLINHIYLFESPASQQLSTILYWNGCVSNISKLLYFFLLVLLVEIIKIVSWSLLNCERLLGSS